MESGLKKASNALIMFIIINKVLCGGRLEFMSSFNFGVSLLIK